ncbi:hypothetical protein ACWDFH_26240 [Streptomyces kronopolitis]
MTVVPHRSFRAEHAAADRLDSPVGREMSRIANELDQLTAEFTDGGRIDVSTLDMIRIGLDRLDMHSKVLALADDLVERAGVVRGLVAQLAGDRTPGAVYRTQAVVNACAQQLIDLISDARTDETDAGSRMR